jgi:hypothetical protein
MRVNVSFSMTEQAMRQRPACSQGAGIFLSWWCCAARLSTPVPRRLHAEVVVVPSVTFARDDD